MYATNPICVVLCEKSIGLSAGGSYDIDRTADE